MVRLSSCGDGNAAAGLVKLTTNRAVKRLVFMVKLSVPLVILGDMTGDRKLSRGAIALSCMSQY